MTNILIEAKCERTPECHFLRAVINRIRPQCEIKFIFMDGIGNLFKETILNQIRQAALTGEGIILLADADTVAKGYGFARRNKEIDEGMKKNNISVDYFLYPDHGSDGDVETLMESTARRDLHGVFFDCYEDYESCVSGVKDENGQPRYNTPNRKGKLHTYITAQELSNEERKHCGSGNWLFDSPLYWNLAHPALTPLKTFLINHLR